MRKSWVGLAEAAKESKAERGGEPAPKRQPPRTLVPLTLAQAAHRGQHFIHGALELGVDRAPNALADTWRARGRLQGWSPEA